MATGRKRAAHLDAIREASAALTSELDLGTVLQTVVDLSRSLVDARYAALGVLNEAGTEIEQFITAGIPAEMRAHIGPFPRGRGLLGAIIREGRTIRVDHIAGDHRSAGDPPRHPHMHTFIGVPILSKGRVLGNLYLTDKRPASDASVAEGQRIPGEHGEAEGKHPPFTEEDEETLELFAMQAAIAIENALLHRRSEQLVIAKERERFAMDLHDGIIQSIYAVGLTLDDGRYYLETNPTRARGRIDQAVGELDAIIADLRAYIMNLEPARFRERDLATGLEELARALRARSFLKVEVAVEKEAVQRASPEQTHELLHIAKEALANAHRHARGTSIEITLSLVDDQLRLTIEDDGVGMDAAIGPNADGKGLPNMEQRARELGSSLTVDSEVGRGTRIIVTTPLL